MTAAVIKFSRINTVEGIAFDNFCGADIAINGSNTAISRNIIQPDLGCPDFGRRMTEIQECSRGAHWTESACCDNIYLAGGFDSSLVFHNIDHFFGSNNNSPAIFDLFVNFFECFFDFKFFHNSVKSGKLFLCDLHITV